MTYELSNEEKRTLTIQHIKNLQYNKYDLELSKMEALAVHSAEHVSDMGYDNQISDITAKIVKLEELLDTLVTTE
jgi:hypothetical protein